MQLKIYIQEQSFYPKMDDDYLPVAANSTTIVEIFSNSFYTPVSLSSEHILFLCPLFVTIIILTLMVIMLMLYACESLRKCKFKGSVKASLKNHTKATILASTVASFNRILIFTAFDIVALAFRFPCSNPKVEAICELSNLIYDTPGALLAYDSFSLLFFVASIVIALLIPKLSVSWLQNYRARYQISNPNVNSNSKQQSIRHIQYFCCTLAAMGFVFSCLMHSPYVIMAYLSDAHYATSILVYYTTVLFIEFGIIQYTFQIYFDDKSFIHNKKRLTGLLVFVQTVLIYCLVLSASFFFYFIPISNTLTNLPNEGIIVYQTALILLGAFITYKALFKSKKSEQDKQSLNLYQLSRQLKEREIAQLKIEVKYGKHHKVITSIMKDKILNLQKEITLIHIKYKITCLNGSNDTIHSFKIARLKRQQNEIIADLKFEICQLKQEILRDQLNPPNQQDQPDQPVTGLQPEQPIQGNEQIQQRDQGNEQGEQNQKLHHEIINYKQEEIYRLRCEIFDHLLAMMRDLEERFHNQDDIDAIVHEISVLKKDIRQHLSEKKDHLNQKQPQTTEITEQISSIEEEIEHLDSLRVCSSQQYVHQQRRGSNSSVSEDEIRLVEINNDQ